MKNVNPLSSKSSPTLYSLHHSGLISIAKLLISLFPGFFLKKKHYKRDVQINDYNFIEVAERKISKIGLGRLMGLYPNADILPPEKPTSILPKILFVTRHEYQEQNSREFNGLQKEGRGWKVPFYELHSTCRPLDTVVDYTVFLAYSNIPQEVTPFFSSRLLV